MSQILSDNFNRANGNLTSAPYSTMASHSGNQILSDVACPSVISANCVTVDTTNTYPGDQWAQGTFGVMAAGFSAQLELCLRCTVGADSFAGWQVQEGSNASNLFIRTNSTTVITALSHTMPTVAVAGDTYYFSVKGQVYSFYQNGVLVAQYTDGSSILTSGSPGFGMDAFTALTDVGLTLFQTGNTLVVPVANDAMGGGFQGMRGWFAA